MATMSSKMDAFEYHAAVTGLLPDPDYFDFDTLFGALDNTVELVQGKIYSLLTSIPQRAEQISELVKATAACILEHITTKATGLGLEELQLRWDCQNPYDEYLAHFNRIVDTPPNPTLRAFLKDFYGDALEFSNAIVASWFAFSIAGKLELSSNTQTVVGASIAVLIQPKIELLVRRTLHRILHRSQLSPAQLETIHELLKRVSSKVRDELLEAHRKRLDDLDAKISVDIANARSGEPSSEDLQAIRDDLQMRQSYYLAQPRQLTDYLARVSLDELREFLNGSHAAIRLLICDILGTSKLDLFAYGQPAYILHGSPGLGKSHFVSMLETLLHIKACHQTMVEKKQAEETQTGSKAKNAFLLPEGVLDKNIRSIVNGIIEHALKQGSTNPLVVIDEFSFVPLAFQAFLLSSLNILVDPGRSGSQFTELQAIDKAMFIFLSNEGRLNLEGYRSPLISKEQLEAFYNRVVRVPMDQVAPAQNKTATAEGIRDQIFDAALIHTGLKSKSDNANSEPHSLGENTWSENEIRPALMKAFDFVRAMLPVVEKYSNDKGLRTHISATRMLLSYSFVHTLVYGPEHQVPDEHQRDLIRIITHSEVKLVHLKDTEPSKSMLEA